MLIAGRYEVEVRLGEGAFGVVYRCRDRELGRPVALKVLKKASEPAARDRFLREGRVAARVEHPNLVRVLDQGLTEDGAPFLVTEFVDGPSLEARLRAPVPVAQARVWLRQLLEGLAAAHEAGVLHRDIKPANVLLGPGGARLADFGLARHAAEATLTATGQVVGTPAYMAPELFAQGTPNPASDLWSLGALGYELFYGDRWRRELTMPSLALELAMPPEATPPRFGRFPEEDAVLASLLAGDPQQRPTSAALALAKLNGERPQAPPRAEPPPKPGRSRTPVAVLAGLAVLGAVAGTLWPRAAPPPADPPTAPAPLAADEPPALTRARLALVPPTRPGDSASPSELPPRVEMLLAPTRDPVLPLRWTRYLEAVQEAERSRAHSPAAGWLAAAARSTDDFVDRLEELDVEVQQLILDGALAGNLPAGLQHWKERRAEIMARTVAAVEALSAARRPDPSPGYLAHVLHLGRLVPLLDLADYLAQAEASLEHPGAGTLVLAMAELMRRPPREGAALVAARRRAFEQLTSWLATQPTSLGDRAGYVAALGILGTYVLRDQYPEPEPTTLERFGSLLDSLEGLAAARVPGVGEALRRVGRELDRESTAMLMGGGSPDSWQPYRDLRARVRGMVTRLPRP